MDNMDNYTTQTAFCDCEDPEIKGLADELREKSSDEGEFIVNAFYYVRDEIKYFFEPFVKASETLNIRKGNCYNKANLLVALLRAEGIPARFAFKWISGECFSDIPIINTKSRFMRKIKHGICEVYANGEWLEADCTRDKYLSLERAMDFDGKKSTRDHPYLIEECGYSDDPIDAIKEQEKLGGKFGEAKQTFNILGNMNIDELRYKRSDVRMFDDEDIKTLSKRCYELIDSLIKLRHRSDTKMTLRAMEYYTKIYNYNVEVVDRKDKYCKFLLSFPEGALRSTRLCLYNLLLGMVHGINPDITVEGEEEDSKWCVEMVDRSSNSGHILSKMELMAKFL